MDAALGRMTRIRVLAVAVLLMAFSITAYGQATITSINPSQGPIKGGTTVTLTGSGFSGATLLLDYQPITPQSESDSQVVFVTPPHDNGIATVELSGNGPNAYAEFLYVPPPLSSLPPGYITTVMGVGHFRGDGRLATKSMVDAGATVLALAGNGSLYFSEPNQNLIRRVRPDGVVERYAGNGSAGYSGDGGPALQAQLAHPRGIAFDSGGNLFLADSIYANVIRRIDAATGVITTVAGSQAAGFSGDGGPASQALLNDPLQVAFDGAGNLYVLDWGNVRIRKIDTSGIITTIAGTGVAGFSGDGGPATQATFNIGSDDNGGLAADTQGDVFLADGGNGRVRRIDAKTGIITTFVNGVGPVDAVATDSAGNVYVGNNNYTSSQGRILKLSPSGQLLQAWGSGQGFSPDGTVAATAAFGYIQRIIIDSSGNIDFAEYDSNRIRQINIATGLLETIAGMGPHIIGETGPAIATPLNNQGADLLFLPGGGLLTAEAANYRVREMDSAGNVSDFAGNGFIEFSPTPDEVPALETHLYPGGLAVAPNGDVYIENDDGAPIVKVDTQGNLYRVTANAEGFSGDGGPASAAALAVGQSSQIATDSAGDLFIADTGNNRIRRIDATTGIITTVAGNGTKSDCGDGGPAVNACLDDPVGVAVDTDGTIYIGENDGANDRIRKVDPSGDISTFVVVGAAVGHLRLNAAHNLFVAPYRIEPNGHIFQFTSLSADSTGLGDGGPASAAKVNTGGVGGIAIDSAGDLFFSDDANDRVRAIRFGAVISEPGSTVNATGGTPQSAPEGAAFSTALQATVHSSAGNLENGIRVDFVAPSSGPSCSFPNGQATYSTLTGIDGVASATCVANAQVGAFSVTAAPLALGASASFALTNTSAPIAALSPTTLSFSGEAVGVTSAAQAVKLTNNGGATLNITSIATSGTNGGDFAQTNNCGTSLAAGSNCTISVTFVPTASGTRTGSLTITDNAAGSPQSVTLSGTATAPIVALTPTSLKFSSQLLGATSAAQQVKLTNSGSAALSISSIATTGDFAQTNNCGTSLAASAGCVINITFKPTAAGGRTGALSISDNAAGSPQTVALSGTGEDFTLGVASGDPSTDTVTAGSTATYSLSVAPEGGFNQAVSISCTGAPSLATCTASPASVTPDGTNPVVVNITVSTTAATAVQPNPSPASPFGGEKLIWPALGLLLLVFLGIFAPRPRRRAWLTLAFTVALIAMSAACGGGGPSPTTGAGGGSHTPGTPTGTYSLTVSGSDGSLAHSTTLTLTVQ